MRGWLTMNRWALLALVPLCIIAAAASAFRLYSVYPWIHQSQVHQGSSVTISSNEVTTVIYPPGASYTAAFTPRKARQVDSAASESLFVTAPIEGAEGTQLWTIGVDVEADPEFVLTTCELAVTGSDGAHYTTRAAKTSGADADINDGSGACYPTLMLGPTADLVTNEWQPADEQRPRYYELTVVVALPDGVAPAVLEVDLMEKGRYWAADIPG